MLSGYRIMWMYVMFDLPVGTKKERYQATRFRNALLDLGFNMVQFSVYSRCCAGREILDRLARDIKPYVPNGGYVDILSFTDKQFENIIRYQSKKLANQDKNKSQLVLF